MSGTAALCPELRVHPGGRRARGQLLLQSPQVDVHQFRLRLLLGEEEEGPHRRAQHPSRVPAERGHELRGGHRLSRLARSPGPPLPRAQALVRDSPLRSRGPAASRPAGTWSSRRCSLPGSAKTPRFELAAPVPLNLVCFRHRGGDAVNEELLKKLNASGKLYLTHTKLDGPLHPPHVHRPDPHGRTSRARRLGDDSDFCSRLSACSPGLPPRPRVALLVRGLEPVDGSLVAPSGSRRLRRNHCHRSLPSNPCAT